VATTRARQIPRDTPTATATAITLGPELADPPGDIVIVTVSEDEVELELELELPVLEEKVRLPKSR
jgi:hypothetical protein